MNKQCLDSSFHEIRFCLIVVKDDKKELNRKLLRRFELFQRKTLYKYVGLLLLYYCYSIHKVEIHLPKGEGLKYHTFTMDRNAGVSIPLR